MFNWLLPISPVSHIGTWTRPWTSLFGLLWVYFLGLNSIFKVDGLVLSTTDIWEPTLGMTGRMVGLIHYLITRSQAGSPSSRLWALQACLNSSFVPLALRLCDPHKGGPRFPINPVFCLKIRIQKKTSQGLRNCPKGQRKVLFKERFYSNSAFIVCIVCNVCNVCNVCII